MSRLGNIDVRDIPGRLGEIMKNVIISTYGCKAVPHELAPTARAAAYALISAAEVMCGIKNEEMSGMWGKP